MKAEITKTRATNTKGIESSAGGAAGGHLGMPDREQREQNEGGSLAGAGYLRSSDYAKRLGLSGGIFRAANSLRSQRASGEVSEESRYMPVVRKFASLIAEPAISASPTVLWALSDVEAFEEAIPAPSPPAEGQLVMGADAYAGWLGVSRARLEAARAAAEGRIRGPQVSREVRGLAGLVSPASFSPPSPNTYETLWHLSDVRTAYEEGRAMAQADQSARDEPSILTTGSYARWLGVSKEQLQAARYYQRGVRENATKGQRRLAQEISPPSLVLDNHKRNEVWAIEDVRRAAARVAASQDS